MKGAIFGALIFSSYFLILSVNALSHTTAWAIDSQTSTNGIIVEGIEKHSATDKAGLQVGDILLAWRRVTSPALNQKETNGLITSVFDLDYVETEEAPRGEIHLTVLRNNENQEVKIPRGIWNVSVRPILYGELLELYEMGKKRFESNEIDSMVSIWADAAERTKRRHRTTSIWFLRNSGKVLSDLRMWQKAAEAYQIALKSAAESDDKLIRIKLWNLLGDVEQQANNFSLAEAAYTEGLKLDRELSAKSLSQSGALNNLGRIALKRGKLDEADRFFLEAMEINKEIAPRSLDLATVLNNLGIVSLRRGDIPKSEEYHRQSLNLRESLVPNSLEVAASLNNLGSVALNSGNYEAAREYMERGFAIYNEIARDTPDMANVLNNLGNLYLNTGDLQKAEESYKQSLSLRERFLPDSLDVAASLNSLGVTEWALGNLLSAENYHKRSLSIREKLAPESLDVAMSLNNLGLVIHDRGDYILAEDYYKRSLSIKTKIAPNSLDTAMTLNNLGSLAGIRADLATAKEYYIKSLAIQQQHSPLSLDTAMSLFNLGNVAFDGGDYKEAEDYFLQSLALREKIAAESLEVAANVGSLGSVAYLRGDLATAEKYYKRSLSIYAKLAPKGLDVTYSLTGLGNITADLGDRAASEDYYKQSLSIRETLAPDNWLLAETHYNLAKLYRTFDSEKALKEFRLAIDVLEKQKSKLGGTNDIKAGFSAKYHDYYRDFIDLLLKLHQHREAFNVLERGRSRLLLAMLAERDFVSIDIPPQLEKERKAANSEYDGIHAAIGVLNPATNHKDIEELLAALRLIKAKQEEIGERIRQASPRYGSLQYPQPLGVSQTQDILDPGTILLSYSTGKNETHLFVITHDETEVRTLSVASTELRDKIEKYRRLIQNTNTNQNESILNEGKSLYRLLIEPAEKIIEKGTRILVIADGPLHSLPFSAIIRKSNENGTPQYLAEWKPLHYIASATVYAEMKKLRTSSNYALTLTAFGDPQYPLPDGTEVASPEIRAILKRGNTLEPLPASRQEVESLGKLFTEESNVYLASEASEEKAKSIGKDVRYLHFACHALLDERFPLNSALVLSIPEERKEGQENGLLQAWEVFERMRINTDLVVLSGCKTGLGKDLGGEGLIGLTRAFQYAGAHSVMATLWSIADQTTAAFMEHFYRNLKSGKSKDEALRIAQLEFIKNPVFIDNDEGRKVTFDASAPFFWAAFQLIGDWQ